MPVILDYDFTFCDISGIMFLCPLKTVLEIEKPS